MSLKTDIEKLSTISVRQVRYVELDAVLALIERQEATKAEPAELEKKAK